MNIFKTTCLLSSLSILLLLTACEANINEYSGKSEYDVGINTLYFASAKDLQSYAYRISSLDDEKLLETKSSNTFISLWDSNREKVLSKLSENELKEITSEGLVYDPEDEIIADPVFCRILNPNREVKVGQRTYRFVKTGAIIYDNLADIKVINNIDPEQFCNMPERASANIGKGIIFVRLEYNNDKVSTRLPVSVPGISFDGLLLNSGVFIPESKLQFTYYEENGGDANQFQKTISSIFGKSVVSTNYFDSSHRMKLRTFAQDFLVYTTVGMTVRMQQKKMGIWWRKKAQEFRYGWTGIECLYKYKQDVLPKGTNSNKIEIMTHPCSYYDNPVLLFPVQTIDNGGQLVSISSSFQSLVESNKEVIDFWFDNHPEYKEYKYGFFHIYDTKKYSIFLPPYESAPVYNEGRNVIRWDFRAHFKIGIKAVNGNVNPMNPIVADIEKTELSRGEIYAAVKYNNEWRACIISAR